VPPPSYEELADLVVALKAHIAVLVSRVLSCFTVRFG